MARFENKLVLGSWMLAQFGQESIEMMGKSLSSDNLIGFEEDNTTKYLNELITWIPEEARKVPNDLLRQYDDHIVSYWKRITSRRNHSGNTLYPLYFQYLSLLFTEHYLNRYFTDKAELCVELNHYLVEFNRPLPEKHRVEPFKESELNKLAIWIATGGGKTLIMHCNILQFHHYLNKSGKRNEFNRSILLTPNEGLSLQHKDEMDLSDIDSDLFVKGGGNLLTQSSTQIIDIHKLQLQENVGKKGDGKTVAVESFESNNLVLVDEGHRGTGGEDWMNKRNMLCEQGFSFEYSATFGQAIRAANGADTSPTGSRPSSNKYRLIQQYAKCILFDYSYRFFHGDGYGKDHFILNLSDVWTEEQKQLYLTGCILNFYQQKKLYADKQTSIAEYLLADPLWIFVGGKVTAKNEANAETVSDIQAIIQFVARFLQNRENESTHFIELFLKQQDDLRDGSGRSIFSGAFSYLHTLWHGEDANLVFSDVLKQVFNADAKGMLHIVHLKSGVGEIGLRVGENNWFGVVNVGDASKLVTLCEEANLTNTIVTEQNFATSLFQGINKKGSPVNLLLGAKKFTEGWSSWRVSTMGLMNVGRAEGSEIIQLFGRGVRLKGYEFSLKRSSAIHGIKHPPHIPLLETLNVFGIRSDYMKEFEDYLEEEGVGETTTEVITLPVIKRLSRNDLKLIRLKNDIPPFKKAQKPWLEKQPEEMFGRVTLNWYPRIQAKRSTGQAAIALDVQLHEGILQAQHLAFLNFDEMYFELAQYKNEKAWYNLQLDRHQIKTLFQDPSWYRLLIPEDLLKITNFERMKMWQEIATSLLKKYAERYYNFRKQQYESPNLEYYEVTEADQNFFDEYKATIDRSEQVWIDKIQELKQKLTNGSFTDNWSFGNLTAFDFSRHQYEPLIHFKNNEVVKISPVPLNDGERDFITDLKHYFEKNQSFFDDKELYVLRNQSKGKGVGFFEAGNFYPDFIVWLIIGGKQYVAFIDPKGLSRIHGFDDPKIRFHKTVKDIEARLGDADVRLESFIVSNTYQREINWWASGSSSDLNFENHHVLFQKEDKARYIEKILSRLIKPIISEDETSELLKSAELSGSIYLSTGTFSEGFAVVEAYTQFAKSIGFSVVNNGEFVKGSWWRKGIELLTRAKNSSEAQELFEKGKKAIELATIEKLQSEVNKNNAEAAAAFLNSTKDISDVAAQFGSLLLVKTTKDGVAKVSTTVLTTEQLLLVENTPALMSKPADLLGIITN
ncbi:DEAD/DEAH box helicase family protein [Paraglaciecola arctica]|uniref:DEAD/DEAH box helicase family protein n=1 Tax=Paraglaciecola arctica TaxID=1128911 RepID=UPI001C077B8F|nr:DEAD/DEAH box helicase family protein [Paraglaciecola arctica]MBU3004275.1 DEAD/DEAH box helicase family protein [Paraglaciecola arctica]